MSAPPGWLWRPDETRPPRPARASPAAFGATGAGGSIAFADPTYGLAFALTKNRLAAGANDTATTITHTIYDALGTAHPR